MHSPKPQESALKHATHDWPLFEGWALEVEVEIKVSVIIPAHNAAAYISRAVCSALDQTLRELEVIVIDDASSDNTVSIAAETAGRDPRSTLICCKANGGPGAARNIGLDRAAGKWIALLDADDTFAPNRLEVMVRRAEECSADLFADNLVVSSTPGSSEGFNALPNEFMSRTGPISAADFIAMDRPSYGTQAVGFLKPIMRAEFVRKKQIRYNQRLRNGEDFHLYARALLQGGRLFVTPEAWYQYLFRSDSQCRGMEASFPRQLIEGNEDLLQIAHMCQDEMAVQELQSRRKEMDYWIPYSSFVAELKTRQRTRAIRSFCMLPSRMYALRKLGEAGMRRIRKAPEISLTAR